MDICSAQRIEMNKISLWLKILRKYFRKSLRKNLINAILNLESVNQGLRACFLWDVCGSVDSQNILRLVNTLKDHRLIHEDIHVMTICGETLVANRKTFTHLFNAEMMEKYQFVNVCDNLNIPEAIGPDSVIGKQILFMLCSVIEEIKELFDSLEPTSLPSVLNIRTKEDWCIPTILGVLLAYPVVYWHCKDAFGTGRCLTCTPLFVHNISASHQLFPYDSQFVLYSFSIPESLMMKYDVHVENWFISLVQNMKHQETFSNLNKEIKSVVHTSVIL